MKLSSIITFSIVLFPGYCISPEKPVSTYAETDRVVAIAVDGVKESDADKPFKELQSILHSKGYHTLWRGKEHNCRASQPYHLSLPAYANFFTGTVDERIKDNSFKGKLKKKTLFDIYPDSQLFSSWGPIRRVMSNDKVVQQERAFVVFHEPAPFVASDDLIVEAFKSFYVGSTFSFVHLVDADNFAHTRKYLAYRKAANNSAKLGLEIMEHTERVVPGNNLFIFFSDHSRGNGRQWTSHGSYLPESGSIWMMLASNTPIRFTIPLCDHTALNAIVKASLIF